MVSRIDATDAALQLIQQLKDKFGPLLFHQSGGCCDGSQPMCFALHDFKLGSSDVCLGHIADAPFWMSKDQFLYWQHTQLLLDVTKGRGSSFSLEIPLGVRFIIHSRLMSEEELQDLAPLTYIN